MAVKKKADSRMNIPARSREAFRLLRQIGAATNSTLAEKMGLTMGQAERISRNLIEMGLAARKWISGPTGGRVMEVRLVPGASEDALNAMLGEAGMRLKMRGPKLGRVRSVFDLAAHMGVAHA